MAWLAANVSVFVVPFASHVARSANIPGNVGLDGKDKGKKKRKVGKLHCSTFCNI